MEVYMRDVIKEIWYGNVNVAERDSGRKDLKELVELINKNGKSLSEHLDKHSKELFDKYCESSKEYRLLNAEQAFIDGFSLGARIMAEAFIGTNDLF